MDNNKACNLANILLIMFVSSLVCQLIGFVTKFIFSTDGTMFGVISASMLAVMIVVLHYMNKMRQMGSTTFLSFSLNVILINTIYVSWWTIQQSLVLFFFVEVFVVYLAYYVIFKLVCLSASMYDTLHGKE